MDEHLVLGFIMKVFVLLFCVFLANCMSLKDYSRLYFTQKKNWQGVEDFDSLNARLNKERELQEVIYGKIVAAKIYQCTVLRNQFYVASLNGGSSNNAKQIIGAAKFLEQAYQDDDQNFLRACDKILSEPLGRKFVQAQEEFIKNN